MYYSHLNIRNKNFSFKSATEHIILKLLQDIEPSKSAGIDNINGIFLRDGSPLLANHITKLFNLSNKEFFKLVLSPFDYNAITFADHYETARTNFDLSKRKWDTLNIHRVDVEIFLNTWNASPNLPKARLLGHDQLNIQWLTYGNVQLREHWRSNRVGYYDACYLVLAKLNVDVALPNSSNEGNT